jgi:hypothetical protein
MKTSKGTYTLEVFEDNNLKVLLNFSYACYPKFYEDFLVTQVKRFQLSFNKSREESNFLIKLCPMSINILSRPR